MQHARAMGKVKLSRNCIVVHTPIVCRQHKGNVGHGVFCRKLCTEKLGGTADV